MPNNSHSKNWHQIKYQQQQQQQQQHPHNQVWLLRPRKNCEILFLDNGLGKIEFWLSIGPRMFFFFLKWPKNDKLQVLDAISYSTMPWENVG